MTKQWCTEFRAISSITGELTTYCGPNVEGISWQDAQMWCYENATHLNVIGELILEEMQDGTVIDYEQPNLN